MLDVANAASEWGSLEGALPPAMRVQPPQFAMQSWMGEERHAAHLRAASPLAAAVLRAPASLNVKVPPCLWLALHGESAKRVYLGGLGATSAAPLQLRIGKRLALTEIPLEHLAQGVQFTVTGWCGAELDPNGRRASPWFRALLVELLEV